ncbi:L,D-transpeptidase [Patescibacteria group bacterium]|nr:L,D-transpeptidase [Patescibacteria group bacterium]
MVTLLFFFGALKDVKPADFQTSIINLSFFDRGKAVAMEEVKPAAPVELPKPAANCGYKRPENPTYGANVVSVRKRFRLLQNKYFETKVYLENTGNVPWFSDDAACREKIRLGTARENDRASIFYSPTVVGEDFTVRTSGWLANNRIKMNTLRVEPGEIGEFVFYSRAPHPADLYVEYFAPVIENVGWIEGAEFPIHMYVGDFAEDTETLDLKMQFLNESTKASAVDFSGGKKVEIDISDQKMSAKIGNYTIKELLVSSGQMRRHDTPRGKYEVLYKQQVRIGGAPPHYIMPKWQAFRWDGYGIHGLPSLGSAAVRNKIRSYDQNEEVPLEVYNNDVMWTEAVDHLGTPVSHGCVRMGPEDADFMYDFTEIGTPVVIHD